MRLVYGRDADVAHWVASRIPHLRPIVMEAPYGQAFGPSTALGVADERGVLRGGVVYHDWRPHFRSIELSCASEGRRWLSREIVRALLRYAFVQLDCNRLQSVTPLKSDEPRRFLERLGFKREGVVRLGFGTDHAVVYGLLRKEWDRHPYNLREARQGAPPHGQERPEAAARA